MSSTSRSGWLHAHLTGNVRRKTLYNNGIDEDELVKPRCVLLDPPFFLILAWCTQSGLGVHLCIIITYVTQYASLILSQNCVALLGCEILAAGARFKESAIAPRTEVAGLPGTSSARRWPLYEGCIGETASRVLTPNESESI